MSKRLLVLASAVMLPACASMPDPLTGDDKETFAEYLQSTSTTDQEAPLEAISLYEAMARALKYNLDHRVSMMEVDLATRNFKLSRYEMLPQLVANAGYFGRNNEPGASSVSLLTGQESLEPSQSVEENFFTSDLTLSWNALDFGLSYLRARQLGDETLIQQERRRKVISDILQEVRTAYWRAASAERLSRELSIIEADVTKAFTDSRALYSERRTSPLAALSYQRELNDILAEAQSLQRQLLNAKAELARLMNLPAGQDFQIEIPDRQLAPTEFNLPVGEAIRLALKNRPEIREAAYRIRMGDREMTQAIVEALPGIELYGALNYDSNDFLFNNSFASWGARASWNLIRVIETPVRRRRAKANLAVERERALAAAAAVSSQVHLSLVRFAARQEMLNTSKNSQTVQSEILNQIERAKNAKRASYQTYIRERMNTIIAEARYDIAHAEVQEAYSNIYASMGFDPFGADVTGAEDIETLAMSFESLWKNREYTPTGE